MSIFKVVACVLIVLVYAVVSCALIVLVYVLGAGLTFYLAWRESDSVSKKGDSGENDS